MASNSGRKYGSSGRSGPRKRVVIGAEETVRVRYNKDQPQVEAERRSTTRQSTRVASKRAGVSAPASSKQGKRMSDSKRQDRERRQRIIRVRRIALVVAALLAVASCVWGAGALYRAPIFELETISVQGTSHLDRTEVLRVADIQRRIPLLRVNTSVIEKRLEQNPWVQEAKVSRDFPNMLRISIVERKPAVVVDMGGTDLWVVSEDGFWLDMRGEEQTATVVVRDISGLSPVAGRRAVSQELGNAVQVAMGISPQLRKITRAISAPSIEKTAIITEDDIEIYIGEAADIEAKDRVVRKILQREKDKVVYINVRVVDRPTWRGLNSEDQ